MERVEINGVYCDENTKKYYETFGNEIDFNHEYDKYFLNHIPDSLTGMNVLDIGAGNGKYSELLTKKGASKVIAIDSSISMINEINLRKQERNLEHLIALQCDIDDLPAFEYKIHFVISRFSLMYSKNLNKLFGNLNDIMDSNGKILILANFADFNNSRIETIIKKFPIPIILQIGENSVEIKNYANSLRDYHQAFDNNGFKVIEEQQFDTNEINVSTSYEFHKELNFKYVIFSLVR